MILFNVTKVVISNGYSANSVENISITTSLETAKAKAKGVIADIDHNVYILSKDFHTANKTFEDSKVEDKVSVEFQDADNNTYIVQIERLDRAITSGGGTIFK